MTRNRTVKGGASDPRPARGKSQAAPPFGLDEVSRAKPPDVDINNAPAGLAPLSPLQANADAIEAMMVRLALRGEAFALQWCARRLPPRRPMPFSLPPLTRPADRIAATRALVEAAMRGELPPREARDLAQVIEIHLAALTEETLEDDVATLKRIKS